MDNLTHSFVGLVAAKTGLEKLSPGATSLCVLAANAPDSDIVVLLISDRWNFLQHHRGITHAIIGTLFFSILFPLLYVATDYVVARVKQRPKVMSFWGLLVVSLITSATHPLLDWSNNYGMRFFLPWSARWSYGDLVFIVDPFLWLLLGGTAFLLTSNTRFQKFCWLVLGLVLTLIVLVTPRSVGPSNLWLVSIIWVCALICLLTLFLKDAGPRFGSKLALVAVVIAFGYWGALWTLHRRAVSQSIERAQTLIGPDERIIKLAAMPTLANPFKWECAFETTNATYRFPLDLLSTPISANVVRYQKPDPRLSSAIDKLRTDRRLQAFEGFARFEVARFENESCATQTLVQFADLRYTEPGKSRGTFSLELPVDCPDQEATR